MGDSKRRRDRLLGKARASPGLAKLARGVVEIAPHEPSGLGQPILTIRHWSMVVGQPYASIPWRFVHYTDRSDNLSAAAVSFGQESVARVLFMDKSVAFPSRNARFEPFPAD